jgi:membrane protein YfhO
LLVIDSLNPVGFPLRSYSLIAWLTVLGLFVWVFGGALFGNEIWVFRDAGHFYYPLYQFTGEQLAAGSPALWNPYENLGTPLAANPTSALFYPAAWIFALPIDPAWAYRIYVLGHVILALAASYALARRWEASPMAATAGAISYAFCGNVLYQVCNVVFLVGAAWMPLALMAADWMLRERRHRSAVAFGAVLAAMTLGGDPQAAYHAGLLAGLYGLVLWRRERSSKESEDAGDVGGDGADGSSSIGCPADTAGQEPCGARHLHGLRRPVLLALAAGVAFCLAAVQILPSMQFTRISSRQSSDAPRSIYELVSTGISGELSGGIRWSEGLLHNRVDRAMHHGHVYHFSVGPWRLAEYVWPNVMGRQFPTHRRWADAIPSEGRLWVPSLYMGIVPLLLALVALRFRRGDARTVWLSWTAVLCVVGSLGWFGVGWLLREVVSAIGADANSLPVGSPVGGLYWLMTVLLPGYVYFRYPAKLLTLAAVALSMLTAVGWDRVFADPGPRFRRMVLVFGWVSLAGALAAAVLWWFAPVVFRHVAPNIMFGPLDSYGAAADIFRGFGQAAVAAFLLAWILGRAGGKAKWPQAMALVLIVLDLGIANGWMVPTADAQLWQEPTKLAEIVGRAARIDGEVAPARVYRQPGWLPREWMETGSSERLEQVLAWDRETGSPKHNLSSQFAISEVYGTMLPQDYQVLLWCIKRRGGGTIPLGTDMAASAVGYAVLAADESLEEAIPDEPTDGAGQGSLAVELASGDASLWTTPSPMPRAWFVSQFRVLPPLASNHWRHVWWQTTLALYQGGGFLRKGELRDLRREVAVEATEEELTSAGACYPVWPEKDATESHCQIVSYAPSRVELRVETAQPGLVVLADQFFPGWQAEVETEGQGVRRAPILRTNRVMRGVWVDEGSHRLVFRYRPRSVVFGGLLSCVGWLVLAVLGIIVIARAASGAAARRDATTLGARCRSTTSHPSI